MTRKYLTVAEVAERYGLSEWTIYQRCQRGLLPHRKHPGSSRLLFLPDDLDRYDDGAELERIVLKPPARGIKPGRLIRPLQQRKAA